MQEKKLAKNSKKIFGDSW